MKDAEIEREKLAIEAEAERKLLYEEFMVELERLREEAAYN